MLRSRPTFWPRMGSKPMLGQSQHVPESEGLRRGLFFGMSSQAQGHLVIWLGSSGPCPCASRAGNAWPVELCLGGDWEPEGAPCSQKWRQITRQAGGIFSQSRGFPPYLICGIDGRLLHGKVWDLVVRLGRAHSGRR